MLPPGSAVVGRDPGNPIYLNDGRASRHHAEFRPQNGGWLLVDSGSRNGTWLNGSRVSQPAPLAPGDRIQIGHSTLVFDPLNATSARMGPSDSHVNRPPDRVMQIPVEETTGGSGMPLDSTTTSLARDPLVRLQLVYQFSDSLRGCFDLQKLAQIVLNVMFQVVTPDRAVLLLRDEAGAMKPFASRERSPDQSPAARPAVSQSIVRRSAEQRATVVVADTSLDDALAEQKSIVMGRIGSVVCCPLVSGDDVYGVMYMDVVSRHRDFERHQLELLNGIASQAALAIGNCLHHLDELKHRELRMQLDVAARIHDRLLSDEHYESETLEAHAMNRPSARVGGDCFGVHPTPRGPLFTISDSTGHGIGAALMMSTARAYLRAVLACADLPLPGVMATLNSLLCDDMEPGLFVTSLLLRIEDGGRRLRYVMAGHEPPLLYRASEDRFVELDTGGLVLGLSSSQFYDEAPSVDLQPGDRILLFTDGVIEQRNSNADEFGIERLAEVLRSQAGKSAREALESVADAVDAWRGESDQGDDVTMMLIHVR